MTGVAVALTAALAVLAVTFVPGRSAANVAKLRDDIETDPRARIRFYQRALLTIPLVVGIYVIVVGVGGESWHDAGLGWSERASDTALPWSLGSLLAALVVLGFVGATLTHRRPDLVRRAYDATKVIAPTTPAERSLWPAVSFTAGLTEELLYRGLFVLHLHALVPSLRPGLLAVASAVVFGLAHRYQGPFGVISSGVLGLAFGVVAMVTGNVFVVIALHTVWDVVAGQVNRSEPAPATP